MKTSNKLLTGLFRLILLCIGFTMYSSISSYQKEYTIGNCKPVTKTVPIGTLKEIHLNGGIHVQVIQGNVPSLSIQTDENIVPKINVAMKNGVLDISLSSKIASSTGIDIFVTADSLEGIEMEAGTQVETPNGLRGTRLKIKSSAGATGIFQLAYDDLICRSTAGSELLLAGTAHRTSFIFSSGGMIDAVQLQTQKAKVEGDSGGSAQIQVTGELTADVSSGGSLLYAGNPPVETIRATSGGEVQKK
jgi:hypothetical protein